MSREVRLVAVALLLVGCVPAGATSHENALQEVYASYEDGLNLTIQCLKNMGYQVSAELAPNRVFHSISFEVAAVDSEEVSDAQTGDRERDLDECYDKNLLEATNHLQEAIRPSDEQLIEIATSCSHNEGTAVDSTAAAEEVLAIAGQNQAVATCIQESVATFIDESYGHLFDR
jgi:hypothetical protein